jgi:uncharacterized protein with PQ loop repeat
MPPLTSVLGYAPIAAAAFGLPQFLPQVLKLRATRDAAGVSWSWAALTAVSNAAWIGYFALCRYWTALIPSCSVTLLAGSLTVLLARRAAARPRSLFVITAWAAALAAVGATAGRAGLGTLLAAAFVVQVAPSLWTAYRTPHPSGISAGTWALILGELACFGLYGLRESDPRLTALGITGVTASTLMLARVGWVRRAGRRTGWASAYPVIRPGESGACHACEPPCCHEPASFQDSEPLRFPGRDGPADGPPHERRGPGRPVSWRGLAGERPGVPRAGAERDRHLQVGVGVDHPELPGTFQDGTDARPPGGDDPGLVAGPGLRGSGVLKHGADEREPSGQ